jgi:hypothetical protein
MRETKTMQWWWYDGNDENHGGESKPKGWKEMHALVMPSPEAT